MCVWRFGGVRDGTAGIPPIRVWGTGYGVCLCLSVRRFGHEAICRVLGTYAEMHKRKLSLDLGNRFFGVLFRDSRCRGVVLAVWGLFGRFD